ncbi:MAG: hypothetical protein ACOX66_09455 [Oscillospiraceae bacterium]|jgi:hypothetical protein
MTIQVLVCRADGTQAVETREVPSDWLPAAPADSGTGGEPAQAEE